MSDAKRQGKEGFGQSEKQDKPEETPARKIRLLAVDDEGAFLSALSQRLELRGFEVTATSSGYDALNAARNESFDLALLDLKMPGMDGKALLSILKKRHHFLEVVMLTGHGSLDSAVECTKLGAFDYLPKPVEHEALVEKLREAYEARLRNKLANDERRMEELESVVLELGESPLGIMRRLRRLDDDRK